jgi:hypothetical protein
MYSMNRFVIIYMADKIQVGKYLGQVRVPSYDKLICA